MKVLFIHFRSAPARGITEKRVSVDSMDSAGTDGVSLEMAKRRELLQAMGHIVAVCSACEWADFQIPDLEFDSEETMSMVGNLFNLGIADVASEAELRNAFDNSRLELKRQLAAVIEDFAPDMLFVHNVFCLPIHPVATVSLAELLKEQKLPCAAIHHDILSEGAYKFNPTNNFARSLLEEYYPPALPNLRHWTINTRNKMALAEKGIQAEVIHDTMDFDYKLKPTERARIRASLRAKYGIEANDVVLFVGARIVPNKQTELAGHLTAVLQSVQQEMIGKRLYHGEVFSEQGRVVLVLAGRPERAFIEYQKKLFELFNRLNIIWVYAGDDVRPNRSEDEGLYSLYPDWYAIADFVLYTTGWEGFGNQLLEAFAAELPVVVFEYPVFKEDIAPKGVEVISLGDTLLSESDSMGLVQISPEALNRAAHRIMALLTNPEEWSRVTSNNIKVCKKYFSYDVLRAHLDDAIEWARSIGS
jgi:glycosyltransferase involved in cell wall biosynthesis